MLDLERLSEELEFTASFVEIDGLQRELRSLVGEGSLEKARLRLEEIQTWGDDTRSCEENVWLYGALAQIYMATERLEESIEALETLYHFEPRNREAEETLMELLSTRDRYEKGLEVARMLLLNHKEDLSDEEIAIIYQKIGALHEGKEDFDRARTAYEKALVKETESPVALAGLLRTVGKVGEPGDVVDARLKLIRSLDEDQARSKALVALGNDWVETFNDPARALDTFEEAVMEWPENIEAVQRIADVASELADWRRVSRAYFTLSMLLRESDARAEYLIRSSDVARKELWEPEKALAGYRKALEFDPTRLDAFRAITTILVDAQDWESLEQDYIRIISVNREREGADPHLLGILWEKLADLYYEYLNRFEDAIFAYSQTLEHDPGRKDIRLRLIELSEEAEGHYDVAEKHLRHFAAKEPQKLQWLDRLGRVALRKKEVDKAYCIFRALRARGEDLDEKATQFLNRFDSKILRPIRTPINTALMQRYVFEKSMNGMLNQCFAILLLGLQDWVGESRRKYGLGRKDQVKLSESLVFVGHYNTIGTALGHMELPELWRKSDQVGLYNGALVPPGLIVGDELLGSGKEKHIAFTVAKQLFLFRAPFYLATIRPLSDLQAFFYRAAALVRPESELAASFAKDKAFKMLRKRIKGEHYETLRHCVEELTTGSDELTLGPWVESIEDAANRIGLLFCDDLQVARECIQQEPQTMSQRSPRDRIDSLIQYSISERYLELRSQIGIEVAK